MPDPLRLMVIAGPTGSGKSELAVKAALFLDGEIINADSVQVYRHFDIGSAKPGSELLGAVRHHLLGFVEPDHRFTMWDFRLAAQKAIEEITSRKKLPILVGGTGLYLKALLENLDGGAEPDPRLRAGLFKELASEGLLSLYERLKKIDPQRARSLHPNDRHRIIRALENALLPQKVGLAENPAYGAAFFVLCGPRKLLYKRINMRVEKMFEAGWIDETRSILAMGYDSACKPFLSVGYKEIVKFLDGGLPKEELVAQVQKNTRRYAKRQITWFSRVKGAVWVNAISGATDGGDDSPANYMADYFGKTAGR